MRGSAGHQHLSPSAMLDSHERHLAEIRRKERVRQEYNDWQLRVAAATREEQTRLNEQKSEQARLVLVNATREVLSSQCSPSVSPSALFWSKKPSSVTAPAQSQPLKRGYR